MEREVNVVITAGGTIETIDDVRSIANTSTGKLGSLICSELIAYMERENIVEYKIHYIISKTAIRPTIPDSHKGNVIFYEVINTLDVEQAVSRVLSHYSIQYFIHSMAISDFMPTKATAIEDIVDDIQSQVELRGIENLREIIEGAIRNPKKPMDQGRKMSSKKDIVLLLERTPKIIAMIKEMNPEAFLVGFKLLNNVTEEQLVEVANNLASKNSCDMVLANDLKYIMEGNHIGLLIKDGQLIERLSGKDRIAKGIVEHMFK